jgi:hypothetical protein
MRIALCYAPGKEPFILQRAICNIGIHRHEVHGLEKMVVAPQSHLTPQIGDQQPPCQDSRTCLRGIAADMSAARLDM